MNILIIGNESSSIFSHRQELIKALIDHGYNVTVAANVGKETPHIESWGCRYIDLKLARRSTNPLTDLKLYGHIRRIIKEVAPSIVLTFYTKTNIWGGLASCFSHVPYIINVTGLGSIVEGGGLLGKLTFALYKISAQKSSCIFFQNHNNYSYFKRHNVPLKNYRILPGSGVSLDRFPLLPYPNSENIEFSFISRIVKEKGIDQFIEAAKSIKQKRSNVIFNVVGPADNVYSEILKNLDKTGIINYYGPLVDLSPILKRSHCIVFPSYYGEGMANVLLEGASSGRPLITTNRPGCGETVDDGITGYIVNPKDSVDLEEKINRFLELDKVKRVEMGLRGRDKMEREFDREIVTTAYLDMIKKISN